MLQMEILFWVYFEYVWLQFNQHAYKTDSVLKQHFYFIF